ncbi:hypothetical protein COV94_00030, partial [Candidatus Woesearchaeota archaeon CG11_big_fil_rev_8_21_14_0_20_57_5]
MGCGMGGKLLNYDADSTAMRLEDVVVSESDGLRRLGKGRAATVYLVPTNGHAAGGAHDQVGRPRSAGHMVLKRFSGHDSLTSLVNVLCSGAPNHYAWNPDAIESAHHVRTILGMLVPFWTEERMSVAASYGYSFN